MDAFARRPAFSSITMQLKDKASFDDAQDARREPIRCCRTLEVKPEIDYWAAQSEQFATFVQFLGIFVAVIFAFGAVLGAMITMYAQVAARTREIGTLRALGFRRRAVLVSFVVESVLLAVVAGAVGVAAASLMQLGVVLDDELPDLQRDVLPLPHEPGCVVTASLVFAVVMGYAGGLLPAMRAARMPIVRATRGG